MIDKKKLAKKILNKNIKVIVIYIKSFSLSFKLKIITYLAKKRQINLLFAKKVKILVKYSDFFNLFLKEKFLILLKLIKFNKYTIKLQNSK